MQQKKVPPKTTWKGFFAALFRIILFGGSILWYVFTSFRLVGRSFGDFLLKFPITLLLYGISAMTITKIRNLPLKDDQIPRPPWKMVIIRDAYDTFLCTILVSIVYQTTPVVDKLLWLLLWVNSYIVFCIACLIMLFAPDEE